MLAFDEVRAGSGNPDRTLVFLHGILGQGANWRSMARRLVQRRPQVRAILVDLRMHGDSRDLPGPHTLAHAAADLSELPFSIDAIVGHSFGGKVALRYASDHPLEELWLIDSMPGPRPNRSETIADVLRALDSAPQEVERRDDFVAALVADAIPQPIARWLAMSLRRDGDGFAFVTDLAAIRALLDSYFPADLWHVVQETSARTHLVVGQRSTVFESADLDLAQSIAATRPNVSVHQIDAGHWVHVEAPRALLELLAPES